MNERIETNYAAVRAKLNEHCYHEHLSPEAVLLVATMLDDLVASKASLEDLRRRDDEKTKELQLLISELDALRVDLPRRRAANDALHVQLLDAVGVAERWQQGAAAARRQTEERVLELRGAQEKRSLQKEQELQQLQGEAIKSWLDDEPPRRMRAWPERTPWQPEADVLMAKEECLSDSLYLCRKQILEMESQVAASSMRAKDLEMQAEDFSEVEPEPKLRAMKSSLEAEASKQRSGLEELEAERQRLEADHALSTARHRRFEEKVQELREEEATLRADEVQEAAKASELLQSQRSSAERRRIEIQGQQRRVQRMQDSLNELRRSGELVARRLEQLAREEVARATQESLEVKELLDRLVQLQQGEVSSLQQQMEAQLLRAEEESEHLASSRAALEEEVQAATLEAEVQARQLETQRRSMDGDLQSGAELQNRWQGADAHLGYLNASVASITDEQRMLKLRLQEQQASLHEEGLQRVQTQVEVQRLQARVRSLDQTREEWLSDLTRAVQSLRQSHASLTKCLQEEETVQVSSDKLRHEVFSSELSLQVATAQREDLASEVKVWTEEVQMQSSREEEARRCAQSLVEELREASLAPRIEDADLASLRAELVDLQDHLARVDTATAALRSKVRRNELASDGFDVPQAMATELAACEIACEAISSKCWQLQEDLQEKQLEVSAEEVAEARLEDDLERSEQRMRAQRLAEQNMAAGWAEDQRRAARDLELLRKAAAALDAQRDEKQRLADERAQELEDLKASVQDHKQSLQAAQQVLDDLRISAEQQQKHLDQQHSLKRDRSEYVEELTRRAEQLQLELRERSNEVTCILDDLQHMVKENQELHEEVRKLDADVAARTGEARKQLQQQESSAQELHALDLERADIARLHEQVCLENRQQEVTMNRLKHDKELARRAAGDLAAELRRLGGLQESFQDRAEQYQLDILVMQEQIGEITQRISSCEESQQKALEEDAKLKGDVAAAMAAAQGADRTEAVESHAVASLRLRRHQLHSALQQTKLEIGVQKRAAEHDWSQVRDLESLLEQGQVKLHRASAELQALEKLQASGPMAIGDSKQLELKNLIEERYAKVGELDAEQQRLQEVIRWRERPG